MSPVSPDEATSIALLGQRLEAIERKLDKVVDDHESRLRRLEAISYALPPTVILAIASIIVATVK